MKGRLLSQETFRQWHKVPDIEVGNKSWATRTSTGVCALRLPGLLGIRKASSAGTEILTHLGKKGLPKTLVAWTQQSTEAETLGDPLAPGLWPEVLVAVLTAAAASEAKCLWPSSS